METPPTLCGLHAPQVHAMAHESGHAVAAVARGIGFKGIAVARDVDELVTAHWGLALGYLDPLTDDPRDWVLPQPAGAGSPVRRLPRGA